MNRVDVAGHGTVAAGVAAPGRSVPPMWTSGTYSLVRPPDRRQGPLRAVVKPLAQSHTTDLATGTGCSSGRSNWSARPPGYARLGGSDPMR